MACRACVQLPIYVDGIDAIIVNQILTQPHNILFHLEALDYFIKTDIGTLNKERGDIFSKCFTEIFKEKLLKYVNEVLFEMVKKSLNDTYLGGTTPTALKNEVSTFRKCIMTKRLGLWSIIQ